jgi:negative regulator of sigma E activity
VNTPHPELERLAELADQAALTDSTATTDDPQAVAHAELLAHVAGCAVCTADLESLRGVRDILRSLPPVPMPADVAARIDAALRAAREPAGDVIPLKPISTGRPARWRSFPYAAAAAVVAVLALGVGAVEGLSHMNGGSKKSASTAAAAASSANSTLASGTNYTADLLRSQVAGLVNSRAPDAAQQFPGLKSITEFAVPGPTASSSAAAGAAAGASPLTAIAAPSAPAAAESSNAADKAAGIPPTVAPARLAPSGPLADPTALQACIQTLVGKAEQPLLVDYATFNGAPSTIIVLPDPDVVGKLDIYVEADTANCANEQVTFVAFLPPTSTP